MVGQWPNCQQFGEVICDIAINSQEVFSVCLLGKLKSYTHDPILTGVRDSRVPPHSIVCGLIPIDQP